MANGRLHPWSTSSLNCYFLRWQVWCQVKVFQLFVLQLSEDWLLLHPEIFSTAWTFSWVEEFWVAAEQKPYVWQSNKKCLSLYVDIPSMTLQVCLVKRAHHIDFVDASHALDINLHNIRLFYHEVLLHFSIKAPHKLDGFNIDKQGN